MEAIERASLEGRVPVAMAGVETENCFCEPELGGTVGTGCEPDAGCAAQQFMAPPPWQQARIGRLVHDGTVCDGRNGVPASNKLQTMINASFMP